MKLKWKWKYLLRSTSQSRIQCYAIAVLNSFAGRRITFSPIYEIPKQLFHVYVWMLFFSFDSCRSTHMRTFMKVTRMTWSTFTLKRKSFLCCWRKVSILLKKLESEKTQQKLEKSSRKAKNAKKKTTLYYLGCQFRIGSGLTKIYTCDCTTLVAFVASFEFSTVARISNENK